MSNKYLGIRFPFTAKDDNGFFVDMDNNPYYEVKNDLMHLIFTPIGTRLRKPNFGSHLIEYIFEQKDNVTYGQIKEELQRLINKYFPTITIDYIKVTTDENNEKYVSLKYTVAEGTFTTSDEINISI